MKTAVLFFSLASASAFVTPNPATRCAKTMLVEQGVETEPDSAIETMGEAATETMDAAATWAQGGVATEIMGDAATRTMGGAATEIMGDATTDTVGGAVTETMGGAISYLTSGLKTVFTSEDIDKILPHRYPFALVDKVVHYEPGKRAVGIKTVSKNEPHFTGHFPDRPIMPGVLQVEAMAQLAGIVCLQMEGATPGAIFFFGGVDGVKWKRPVVPGDVLVMEVAITQWRAKFGIVKATGTAYVDGEVAAEVGEMTFTVAK